METVASSRKSSPQKSFVYLAYDQAELDAAYNQANFAPNAAHVHARQQANAEEARRRLGAPARLSYGPSAVEKLDLYKTAAAAAPILVYVHGGAWRGGTAARAGFAAEAFVRAGVHFIALDFITVEEAGGRLQAMVEQIRGAIAWIYRNAAEFGGDPNRIHLVGHSSGAHLTSVMLITDWTAVGLPGDLIKGALCCSGMYDLHPVSLSHRSSYVDFSGDVVETLSAARRVEKIGCPTLVAHGTCESPEFQRQNKEFAEALATAGKPVRLLVGQSYNHFEIIETLGNPYGLLGRAVLEQIAGSARETRAA